MDIKSHESNCTHNTFGAKDERHQDGKLVACVGAPRTAFLRKWMLI